jgi:D-alanyl-lipoteichoic acid acyltransferase DltB (MBOAT superfamily)
VLFSSIQYTIFLPIVVAACWLATPKQRRVVLLVASYVFYGWWDWKLLGLLVLATASTYVGGLVLARSMPDAQRRLLLVYALAVPLGTLVAFKVYGFFVSELQDGSASFGLQLVGPGVELVVPVGLSFYTFQACSYVIDVYRGDQDAIRSPVDHALFVSFFPQLLAGPILRARQLVPQLQALPTRPDPTQTMEGLELILTGLFKKVALADPLTTRSVELVAGLEGGVQDIGTVQAVLAAASAVLGGYFDIAGYVDMARGSAKLLGIDMQPNFVQPLTRSKHFQDFWRRWQITIMGWFRDYVFSPLRGRRPSAWRESAAVVGTFVAVAFWHSGLLTWVIWALLVSGTLIVETAVRRRLAARRRARRGGVPAGRSPAQQGWRRLRGVLYTWVVLLLTSVWVGAPSIDAALDGYRSFVSMSVGTVGSDAVVWFAYGLGALILLDRRERVVQLRERTWDPPTWTRTLAGGYMLLAILVLSGADSRPFIYLQF